MKTKKLLSLFSGCGGLDIGFEGDFKILSKSLNKNYCSSWIKDENDGFITLKPTSFETIFANDILLEARIAWINYFKNKKKNAQYLFYLDSIVDLVKKHKSGIKIFPQNVDIVTGGFPCQDFSVAGKRLGFNSHKNHNGVFITEYDNPTSDNRGKLYMWMREVINIVNPKMFVAENVKGLTTLENVKEIIENDFRNIGGGYIVVPSRVLQAAEYGVPQSRERVIFIGFNRDFLKKEAEEELTKPIINKNYYPYPFRTHTLNSNDLKENPKLFKHVSLRDAFYKLKEPHDAPDDSQKEYSRAKYYGKHCQGQIEINLDWIGPTIRAEHHGNIEFRRLSANHGGRYLKELEKGYIERRLTIRECARIQTFPDDYSFVFSNGIGRVTSSKAYKIIGNAVPPLLGYHLAKQIEKNWERYFK